VNTNDSTHTPDPGWQKLGELELPIGMDIDNILRAWLAETLASLALSTDFWNRVLKSAQESATRVLQSEAALNFTHIHFSIFAPHEQDSKGKSWGFFLIERIENWVEGILSRNHAIDLYLYMEGE